MARIFTRVWLGPLPGRCDGAAKKTTEMTPDQQRIAIAEACGRDLDPNDLNAMHEVEKTLKEKQRSKYSLALAHVLDTAPNVDWADQFLNIHATAAQRAEAFLKTIGEWRHE